MNNFNDYYNYLNNYNSFLEYVSVQSQADFQAYL